MTKAVKEVKPWWEYIEDVKYNGYWEPNVAFVAPYIFKQSVNHQLPFLFNSRNGAWTMQGKALVKHVKKELDKLGGNSNYEKNNSNFKQLIGMECGEFTYVWLDTIVQVDIIDGYIGFCTCNKKLYNALSKLSQELLKEHKPKPNGKVYALIPNGSGGLTSSSIGIGASPLIKENYTDEAIEGYNRILEDIQSDDPLGRLSILEGPAGTGKTHLIRALLKDCPDLKFLILPSNVVSEMSGPMLLQALINESEEENDSPVPWDNTSSAPCPDPSSNKKKDNLPLVLIIEDADQCLSARKADNMGSISTLLNASDGIIASCLNLRIICTTNTKTEEFDEALLRDGRLSAKVVVGLLDRKQASEVYKRIGGKGDPVWEDKFIPLSTVYKKAKGKNKKTNTVSVTEKPKNRIGFTT